jgi:drug/metabolite transporter (DMT)-like permease
MTGSVLFSGKAIVVKLAYRYGVDAATLIALRMLAAAPLFALAYVWSSRGAPALTRGDHLRLAFVGLIGYYAASMLDFLGLQYVTAALERLILYLSPTLVLLLSALFLGRRVTRGDLAALGLAYSGIALAFWHDVSFAGERVALGTALVFASAVCYAIYLVMSGELVRRIGAIRLTSYAMLAATGGVLAQFFTLRAPETLLQPAPVLWLSLFNGVACTVLPVFATMLAVERIGAARTALASMVGPVATIGLGWIFLGEAASLWQGIGTALVLAGVYVLSRQRPEQPDVKTTAIATNKT